MRFFIVIFLLSVICPLLLDTYVDWSWFTAVEHTELFTVKLQTQVVLWVASFVLTWFLCIGISIPLSKVRNPLG